MPDAPKNRDHLIWLDSLRAIAAIWVVIHHAFLTIWFPPVGLLQKPLWILLNRGHLAVVMFIAISGYSLALQTSKSEWRLRSGYKEFLLSRAIRIIPPYYAAIALSLLAINLYIGSPTGTHWDVSIPVSGSDIVKHLLLVQNFSGAPKINHAFWSISLEFQIYLFFGLILWAVREYGTRGVAATALFFGIGSQALCSLLQTLHMHPDTALVQFFPVFIFGVFACKLSNERKEDPSSWLIFGAGVTLCVPAIVAHFSTTSADLVFGVGCVFGLYSIPVNKSLTKLFSWKPLGAIGGMGYSIYLVHAPILQIVYQAAKIFRPADTLSHFLLYLLIAIPSVAFSAILFFICFERPCFKVRHWLRRKVNSEKQIAPAQD